MTRAKQPRRPESSPGAGRQSRGGDGLGGEQVEGRNAVRELLRAGRRRVSEVWIAPLRDAPVLEEIRALAGERGVRVHAVTGEGLGERARTDAPQGVVARAAPLAPCDLDDLLGAPDAFLLALDGVTDPRNLGAVLRAAETAGVTGVVLPRHRSARLTPAAMKAAAGAAEHLAIATASGVPAVLDRAARGGCGPSGWTPTVGRTSSPWTSPTGRWWSCSAPKVAASPG